MDQQSQYLCLVVAVDIGQVASTDLRRHVPTVERQTSELQPTAV